MPVWLALTLMVFAAAAWGGSSVAGRAASGNVPPMTYSFLRWSLALMLFLPFGARPLWAERRQIMRQWPILALFGFFGMVGFTVPYFVGLQFTPAINVTLLNGLVPVMTVLLSFAMLGVIVTPGQSIGIVLALAGTMNIVIRGDINVLLDFRFNIGDLLALSAFLSWSFYTVMLKWKPADIGPYSFLVAITAFACLMMLPMCLWEISRVGVFDPTVGNLAIVGYAAVFPSFLAYLCWNAAVPVLGANLASITQYLNPVFGVVFAIMILSESFETYHMIGVAAIFVGLYLSTRRRGI